MQVKLCRKCKAIKPVSDFYDCPGGKFGVRGTCKRCVRDSNKARYDSRGSRYNSRKRERYAGDSEYRDGVKSGNALSRKRTRASGSYHDSKLRSRLRQYSQTVEWYDNQLLLQGGVCGICKKPPIAGPYGGLVVDHDHRCCPPGRSCGQCVRGLICHHCNRVLGHSKDDTDILIRAAVYLKSFSPVTTERENPSDGNATV